MKMDVTARTQRSVAVVACLAALLFFVLLAWIGGELHYRNCVTEAELRYPVAYRQGGEGAAGEIASEDLASRDDAIAGCSRWP